MAATKATKKQGKYHHKMCCKLKQLLWLLLLLLCQHVEPKSLKFFTNALAADLRPKSSIYHVHLGKN